MVYAQHLPYSHYQHHFWLVLVHKWVGNYDLLLLRRITHIFQARSEPIFKKSWQEWHANLVGCHPFWPLMLKQMLFSRVSLKGKKVLQERLSYLTIEREWYLEELKKATILLLLIGVDIQTFRYRDLLAEREKKLVQDTKKKDGGLTSASMSLSKTEDNLIEANQTLDSSRKTVEELELSLSEALEGWKKAKDDLQEMHFEKISLYKEYRKLV